MCCVVIGLEKGHGSTDAAVERKVENLDDDGDVLLLLTTTNNNNDVVVINKNTHCGVLVLFLSYIWCFIYLQQQLLWLQFVCFC